jgi:ABC-type cobalt transport system substrate-binding protein
MTAVVVVALVIVAVIVAAGLVVLVFVTRDAYRTRDQWAEEDRAAGADPRRDSFDRGLWPGL